MSRFAGSRIRVCGVARQTLRCDQKIWSTTKQSQRVERCSNNRCGAGMPDAWLITARRRGQKPLACAVFARQNGPCVSSLLREADCSRTWILVPRLLKKPTAAGPVSSPLPRSDSPGEIGCWHACGRASLWPPS